MEPARLLNLDDHFLRAVGGTGVDFRKYHGVKDGAPVPLDNLAANADLLNSYGNDVRWMMEPDAGAVPYEYRWTTIVSLGQCETISDARRLCEAFVPAVPMQGHVDHVVLKHFDTGVLEALVLYEFAEDAVYQKIAA